MGKKVLEYGDQIPESNDDELELEDEEELEDDDQEDEDDDQDDEDQDDDDDDSDDDDEDEKPKRKSVKPASAKDIAQIKKDLAALRATTKKEGDAQDQKKMTRVEKRFATWLQGGKKPEQLQELYNLMDDIKEDLREEYQEKQKGETQSSLNERSVELLEDEFDKLAERDPSIGWSKREIMSRAYKKMQTNKRYEDARETFSRGRLPAAKHYKDALLRTIDVFKKETGRSTGAKKETPGSLDNKNSRTRSKSSEVGEGEVNLDKLDKMEREIYTTTLNYTKNKEIAKQALKDLRGKL